VSRLFEALRKTEGELADMARAVLAEETLAIPALDQSNASASLTAPAADAAETKTDHSPQIRSAKIELAAGSLVLPFDARHNDAATEQYRIIRTKIYHHARQPRVLLISSPMPGDGKTINAINLAVALSLQEDLRVLLLDCDFRRSCATKLLGLGSAPGLGEVLRNEASLEEALTRIEQFPNLYVLSPGVTSQGPGELLTSARWQSLIERCCSEFRFVVVDAPPIGAVAEYELLQLACDGIVLVVRQDFTNRRLWRKALKSVPKEKQIGAILNCAQNWFLWKTDSYYYSEEKASNI
jgi:capsular exopolysaccharide synthesis family protein